MGKKKEEAKPEIFDDMAYRYFHSKLGRPDIYRFVQIQKIRAIVKDYLRRTFKNVTVFDVVVSLTATSLEIIVYVDKPRIIKRRVRELQNYLAKMLGINKHEILRDVRIHVLTKTYEDFSITIEKPDGTQEVIQSEETYVLPDANYIARIIARGIERGRNYRAIIHGYLKALQRNPIVRGCEILVSGKLRGERARTERYYIGTIPKAGHPRDEIVQHGFDEAVTRMGVIGVTVRLFLKKSLPDDVEVLKPEELPESRAEVLKSLKPHEE